MRFTLHQLVHKNVLPLFLDQELISCRLLLLFFFFERPCSEKAQGSIVETGIKFGRIVLQINTHRFNKNKMSRDVRSVPNLKTLSWPNNKNTASQVILTDYYFRVPITVHGVSVCVFVLFHNESVNV